MLDALLLATAMTAQPAPDVEQKRRGAIEYVSEEAAKVEKTKRVCRSILETGTRVRKKVCRVQTEWDEQTENHRNAMDDINSTGVGVDLDRGLGKQGPPNYANQQTRAIPANGGPE